MKFAVKKAQAKGASRTKGDVGDHKWLWPAALMLAKNVGAGLALIALGFFHALSESLQQCQGLQGRKPRCDFGVLPGRWGNCEGRSGWRPFDPDCQLEDLVKLTGNSTVSGASQQGVSVLFFGGKLSVLAMGEMPGRLVPSWAK